MSFLGYTRRVPAPKSGLGSAEDAMVFWNRFGHPGHTLALSVPLSRTSTASWNQFNTPSPQVVSQSNLQRPPNYLPTLLPGRHDHRCLGFSSDHDIGALLRRASVSMSSRSTPSLWPPHELSFNATMYIVISRCCVSSAANTVSARSALAMRRQPAALAY